MRTSIPSVSRAYFILYLVLICLVLLPASTCSETIPLPARPVHVCKQNRSTPTISPSLQNKSIVPGALQTSLNVTASGDATLSLPLPTIFGRAGVAPDIAVHYNSGNADANVLGVGFSLSAASVISRRSKTMAIDGEIAPVQYTAEDAFALDGQPLVIVASGKDVIEYRTIPDTQIKVLQHVDPLETHFEAWYPDGSVVLYGVTDNGRPMANTFAPREWLAEEQRDPRGNTILFDYCFADDATGYTAEYALTSIRYSAFDNEEPQRTVVFAYETRDDVGATFSRGMQLQESLQLREVQIQGPGDEVVRRYEFDYAPSETTGRTLLQSVQACAGHGECFEPTRFHYREIERGFEDIATDIAATLSDKASPMFFDIDRDGLSDYVVPDSTALSTPEHPVTQWRVAKSRREFIALKVTFSEKWSMVQQT